MRLLDTRTVKLKAFLEDNTRPPYAILSHRWKTAEEEVTFQDLNRFHENDPQHPSSLAISLRAGYRKIEACCSQALRDGIEWAWVDTCCIDKSSSVELSEAINSMFRWYKESRVCYAYLEGVLTERELQDSLETSDSEFMDQLRTNEWFDRGWTLQELLAPREIRFFSESWTFIGNRSTLRQVISEITSIPPDFLIDYRLSEASIAQRMSWAAKRKTSRKEDIAYCLLGLFDIYMPLQYGEGEKRAFYRLQEEIIKRSEDQTIFAWGYDLAHTDRDIKVTSVIAGSPSDFAGCKDVVPCNSWTLKHTTHHEITKIGLHLELKTRFKGVSGIGIGILNCRKTDDFLHLITIPLSYTKSSDRASLGYGRLLNPPGLFDETHLHTATLTEMYISDPESTTALSTSKWSFPHSALMPVYPGLQCETLYIDASLRSVTSNFHSRHATHHWITRSNIAYPGVAQKQIHVYRTDAPVPSQEPGRYPTAYFRCWSNSIPGSSRQDDFLVKIELTPYDSWTERALSDTRSGVFEQTRASWRFRCCLAQAPGPPRPSSPIFGSLQDLEALEWRQDISSGDSTITTYIYEQTLLGDPTHIIALRKLWGAPPFILCYLYNVINTIVLDHPYRSPVRFRFKRWGNLALVAVIWWLRNVPYTISPLGFFCFLFGASYLETPEPNTASAFTAASIRIALLFTLGTILVSSGVINIFQRPAGSKVKMVIILVAVTAFLAILIGLITFVDGLIHAMDRLVH